MRFDELCLESYGGFERRRLSLAGRPGLAVVYGPNEAGKSTCLMAILDFLFGIPHNSAYGQVFGYDRMRLNATLRMSDGREMVLRRRKGRGIVRTLMDKSSKVIDEGVLAAQLGATTRTRFESLFGLDHASLRSGGSRLLAADGDIGRLIVEAGGGLRTLVTALDGLAADADGLFSPRRSAERAFYKALDAFEAADKETKTGLLTRDSFLQGAKQHEAAVAALEGLRESRRGVMERISRQQRLVRVVAMLKELERLDLELGAYTDLPAPREGFPEAVRDALCAHEAAAKALQEAEEERARLQAKVDTLIVPAALIEAEASIRDMAEKAGHVVKVRADRPKRQTELADSETKLAAVRRSVGAAADVALETQLPPQSAIARVQALVAHGLGLRPKIDSLTTQIGDDELALKRLEDRQAARRQKEEDKPFGIGAGDLPALATLTRLQEARGQQMQRLEMEIVSRLRALAFSNIGNLRAFVCPDSAAVQAELERRTALEAQLSRQIETIEEITARQQAARAEIERLETGSEVPTGAAIAAARQLRDKAWATIRGAYVETKQDAPLKLSAERRLKDAARLDRRIEEADELSDRRSSEAQRAAALELAEKQATEAAAALAAAASVKQRIEAGIEETRAAWSQAWPAAVERASQLGRLKALAEERASLLQRVQDRETLRCEIDQTAAELEPKFERLSSAEEQFGLAAQRNSPIAARVQAVTQRIVAHDDGYGDYRRDAAAIADTADQLLRKRKALTDLLSALAKWREEWTAAVRAIGLEGVVSPERGNEVATQWAAAAGVLDGLRITRARLQRMDEDEAELKALIARLSGSVEFPLPEDPVAAARMLHERWVAAHKLAIERASLMPQLEQRNSEKDRKQKALDAAAAATAALCAEAGCPRELLAAAAEQCRQRLASLQRRHRTLESLMAAGDGHSLESLRQQWGGRDPDEIAATLKQMEQELLELDHSIEKAVAEAQENKRALERCRSLEGINAAVAKRESAAADMHRLLERYVQITLAKELLTAAIDRIRAEQQDPLVLRASQLFALTTRGAFSAVETDVDHKGTPVVVGRRATGERISIGLMSEGTRDQLFLAFRIASVEHYCASAEPLPFIGDDLLVHFDDERSAATLELLAEFAKTTQVLLFTHHRKVCEAAAPLVARGLASIVELDTPELD